MFNKINASKIAIAIACVILPLVAAGQQPGDKSKDAPKPTIVRRIKIRHADPQLIALLLAGKTTFLTPPEITHGSHKDTGSR